MPGHTVESLSFASSDPSHRINNAIRAKLESTPRPTPLFYPEAQTFSTKKARGTPRDALPPRPPVKSAPPVSRIFQHRTELKALPVSFRHAETSLMNSHYNEGKKELYFDQCFEIDKKMGSGSFGEVFRVRSREDGKLYAVKRSRERFRGESDRRRKLEEVAKHETLPPHPNCVHFFRAWEEKQHLYIQTELCKTSLNNLAEQNHHIPEKLVWNYLVDLLMALKHLHDHDLVHMDIKPDNIFISDINTCKLGDFGLVLDSTKEIDHSEAQEGDPKYLAPELLQGGFGKPADVFSLGVSILELASDLDLPKGGDLWHQLRSGHLPWCTLVTGISQELKDIISWMMEPAPEKRPTVDEILSLPVMKKIWKQRKREQTIRAVVTSVNSLLLAVVSLLCTLWLTMTYPLQSLFPRQAHTPSKRDGPCHPLDWDHSFSDDEAYDEGISIHNNSLGVPLDCSTSSEESSIRDREGFVIPSLPRKAMTTPGLRPRPNRNYIPEGTSSPWLSSNASSLRSSSPLSSPRPPLGFQQNVSMTPDSSFSRSLLDELVEPARPLDATKVPIEPRNLMDMFEGASDEDE